MTGQHERTLGGAEALRSTQKKVRRVLASPCDRPPAAPANVVMAFVAIEAKNHLNFRGKIRWSDVTTDTSGLPITTVDRWDIQWRATDADGDPIEPSDAVDQAMLSRATNPSGTTFRYVTRQDHGFSSGMMVTIRKCAPQTQYNGTYSITVTGPTVFTVNGGASGVDDCQRPGEVFHDAPKRVHRTQRRDPVSRANLASAIDVGAVDEVQRVHLTSFGGRNEVQDVSLSGFGGSDRFHLKFGPGVESGPITHGHNYTRDGVKYQIEHMAGFAGKVDITALSDSGFTVEFKGDYALQNVDELEVTHPVGCTGSVNTTTQGSGPIASFKLEWPSGSGNKSGLIQRGANYNAAHVKNRIENIPGFAGKVTVDHLSDAGFTVTYGGNYAATNVDALKVTDESGTTGSVTTETQGAAGTTTYRYTTRGPHGFIVGQHVRITGCKPQTRYNGSFTITAVPSASVFEVTGPSNAVEACEEPGVVYDDDDSLHIPIGNIPRPRSWYWQARVRARSGQGCWSKWSTWTTPVLPWTGADPRPPAPTFDDPGAITFDRVGQHHHVKLRLLFTFDEVQDWDVPGGDHEPDVEAYIVQLDRSDDGITWDGRPYVHKVVAAKDVDSTDDDDPPGPSTRTAHFQARILRRHYYRCRVRTIDRFGRRGDWSEWSSGAQPFDNVRPPAPEQVEIDAAHDRIIVRWDAPPVYVDTRGTVSGTSGTDALTGTGTRFDVEVEAGQRILVGADNKRVKRVISATSLTIGGTWLTTHTDQKLKLVEDDPDVAAYDVQIGRASEVDASTTPDDWSDVYASDRVQHKTKAFRVEPGDDTVHFYGRVRSIDGALNKSRWIPARLSPNDDPDANGETVQVIADRVVITARRAGDLEGGDPDGVLDDQSWRVDRHYRIINMTALVGLHDPDTHPDDGTPGPGGVELNWRRITSDESANEPILDADSRIAVPPNHHKGAAAVDSGDYDIEELFAGEVIYPRINSVGGGAGPRPGHHLVTTVVLKPIGDEDATGTGGGSAFSPDDIGSLVGWYNFGRANSLFTDPGMTTIVTSDGDAIAAVEDQSPTNNHLSGVVGQRPQYKTAILNGHSVGRWDAVNDALVSAAFGGGDKAQPNIIMFVARAPTSGGNAIFVDGLTGSKREAVYMRGSSSQWSLYSGSSEVTGAATTDTSPHIFAALFDGASSKLWVDGGTADAAGNPGTQALDGISLGASYSGADSLGGDIAELCLFNASIGLDNINSVGRYLASRWGLTWITAT